MGWCYFFRDMLCNLFCRWNAKSIIETTVKDCLLTGLAEKETDYEIVKT